VLRRALARGDPPLRSLNRLRCSKLITELGQIGQHATLLEPIERPRLITIDSSDRLANQYSSVTFRLRESPSGCCATPWPTIAVRPAPGHRLTGHLLGHIGHPACSRRMNPDRTRMFSKIDPSVIYGAGNYMRAMT
jgi:hypothetical protein